MQRNAQKIEKYVVYCAFIIERLQPGSAKIVLVKRTENRNTMQILGKIEA